jgi:hypothetical protein
VEDALQAGASCLRNTFFANNPVDFAMKHHGARSARGTDLAIQALNHLGWTNPLIAIGDCG